MAAPTEPAASTPDRLAAFFDLLPRRAATPAQLATTHARPSKLEEPRRPSAPVDQPVRHALEVTALDRSGRRASCELLRAHDIALVVADSGGHVAACSTRSPADFVYVRLHGDEELYASGYTAEALDRWADA